MNKELYEIYSQYSDKELIKVIVFKDDYNEEALATVELIIKERGVSEHEIEEISSLLINEKKGSSFYVNPEIANLFKAYFPVLLRFISPVNFLQKGIGKVEKFLRIVTLILFLSIIYNIYINVNYLLLLNIEKFALTSYDYLLISALTLSIVKFYFFVKRKSLGWILTFSNFIGLLAMMPYSLYLSIKFNHYSINIFKLFGNDLFQSLTYFVLDVIDIYSVVYFLFYISTIYFLYNEKVRRLFNVEKKHIIISIIISIVLKISFYILATYL